MEDAAMLQSSTRATHPRSIDGRHLRARRIAALPDAVRGLCVWLATDKNYALGPVVTTVRRPLTRGWGYAAPAFEFFRGFEEEGFQMQIKSILFAVSFAGLGVAAGCSSSSSSPGTASEDGGSEDGGSSGGSSSGVTDGGIMTAVSCTSAAGCADAGTGFVCCGGLNGTTPGTSCQMGPCTAVPLLNIVVQPCASSAECSFSPNTVCGAPTGMLALIASQIPMVCEPPADAGGSSSSGGSDAGGSSSGGEGGSEGGSSSGASEGGSDAPTGG
jgi:hypothetical protein